MNDLTRPDTNRHTSTREADMIQQNPTDEAPATAAWPGYTPEELAWFAANYADTEWAVHVIGPDDVHTNEPDAQGEHNPDGAPLTEQSAWALAGSIHQFNGWYRAKFGEKPCYTDDLIPNVFHRGVLVETRPFRVGDRVEITAREGESEATPPGLRLNGRTGEVAEIDDGGEYPIGLTVEGHLGPVWCAPGELRRLDEDASAERKTPPGDFDDYLPECATSPDHGLPLDGGE